MDCIDRDDEARVPDMDESEAEREFRERRRPGRRSRGSLPK